MRILGFYVGRIVIQQTLIVLVVLLGLFVFVTLIDELTELGTGSYGVDDVVRFVALSIPRMIYELFPMAALLGTMLGLSMLANSSELVVLRASGVSVFQVAGMILRVGAIFALAGVLIGEFVAPGAETMAQRGRAEAMQNQTRQQTSFGLWMRDQNSYVNIGEVLPDLTLLRFRLFEFDAEKRLRSLVYAERGEYEGGRWRLSDIRQTLIGAEGRTRASSTSESRTAGSAYWRTEVTPQILAVFLVQPEQLSSWQLDRYIDHLKANDQETSSYELAFWNKLFVPVSTGLMVLLAIPFTFRQVRSGGLGRSLVIGIMIGLAFYLTSRGFGYVVLLYDVPPLAGAVAPLVIFGAVAAAMLARVR